MSRKPDVQGQMDFARVKAALAAGDNPAVLAAFEQYRQTCHRLREERDAARKELEMRKADLDHIRDVRRRREIKLGAIVEHSPDGILRLDRTFRLIYANPAAAHMMHTSREELLGKTPVDFPMPLHLASLWQGGVQRVLESGCEEVFGYEFDDQRTIHYLRIIMTPEYNSEGDVESVLARTRDISEQKKTMVALRESEERFRLALEASPIIVFAQDGVLRYTWVYSSHPELQAGIFLDRTDREIYPAEEADRMTSLKQRVMNSGYAERAEFEVTSPLGKRWMEITISPLRNNEGHIIGITGVALDISERKWTEEALRSTGEALEHQSFIFEEVLSSVRDYLYIYDLRGRFVFANKALFDLWGLAPEQVIGKTMRDLGYPGDAEAILSRGIRRVIETKSVVTNETFFVSPSSSGIYHENILAPIFDADGNVIEIAGSSRDVTGRKQAEEALREAYKHIQTQSEELQMSNEELHSQSEELQSQSEELQAINEELRLTNEALRESEERFRAMADGIPQMIWVTDSHGQMQFVNRAYCDFFGVTLEQVQSGGWQVMIHPDDALEYSREYARALSERRSFQARARVLRADGRWSWVESYGNPRFSPSGEFLGIAGSSPEIFDQI